MHAVVNIATNEVNPESVGLVQHSFGSNAREVGENH